MTKVSTENAQVSLALLRTRTEMPEVLEKQNGDCFLRIFMAVKNFGKTLKAGIP